MAMKKGYRALVDGDVIQASDEFLHRSQWRSVAETSCIGWTYGEGLKPMRRKVE